MSSTSQKSKFEYKVFSKGILKYPWLNNPDTKFNENGTFHTLLLLEGDAHEQMLTSLQPILDEYVANGIEEKPARKNWSINMPFEEELDDQGDPTGKFAWKFTQAAKIPRDGQDDLNFNITLLDAKTKPCDVQVGGGSEAKIKFQIRPYAMNSSKSFGLSLKPGTVQIISLVERASNDTSGFEEEEGFTSEATVANDGFSVEDAEY